MSFATTFHSMRVKKPQLKKHSKKLLWALITYQTAKGTLTTSSLLVILNSFRINHMKAEDI